MCPGASRNDTLGVLRAGGGLAEYRGPRDDPEPRPGGGVAAVAVILRPGATSSEILLIERAEVDDDPWSGHMAFPGGRRAVKDGSLLETAVRETREETAVELDTYGKALGRLQTVQSDSVRLPVLSILPLVFSVPAGTLAQAAPSEVARTFWIPLTHFVDPRAQTVYHLQVEGRTFSFPALAIEDQVVWGLTRRILRDLLDRVI